MRATVNHRCLVSLAITTFAMNQSERVKRGLRASTESTASAITTIGSRASGFWSSRWRPCYEGKLRTCRSVFAGRTENWTRRWDGKDQEILIAQQHSPEDDLAIIRDLIRHFRDPRYIRIEGRPLLIVYRTDLLPEPTATVMRWRKECRSAGAGEIYLCTVPRFGMPDPAKIGFDAVVDFPPHGCVAAELTRAMGSLDDDFAGRIFDYRDLVRDALSRSYGGLPNFRGVFPSWDNTARKGSRAHIFHGATPLRYRAWLAEAIRASTADSRLPQPIVFINAWNEWAEGCHLEPDADHGQAWLEATRAARDDASAVERLWTRFGAHLPALPLEHERSLAGAALPDVLSRLQDAVSSETEPTLFENVVAIVRRHLEKWPAVRRSVLPVARRLGLAD